jgi:hypothetical protein
MTRPGAADMTEYRRFQGQLVMFDPHHQRPPRTIAAADRVILRPAELVMDVSIDGEAYSVTLTKSADDVFRGSWTRGVGSVHTQRGNAECRLTPFGDHIGTPDDSGRNLRVEGIWQEDGDWRWIGRLDRVESF